MRDYLLESVKRHEGYRSKAYRDLVGVWTIGYGTNLQVLEIDESLAAKWLKDKLDEACAIVAGWTWTEALNPARQDAIVEMVYNLGPEFGDGDGFKDWPLFVAQMQSGDYQAAARNMLATLWARQVGKRADRLAAQVATGKHWHELPEHV